MNYTCFLYLLFDQETLDAFKDEFFVLAHDIIVTPARDQLPQFHRISRTLQRLYNCYRVSHTQMHHKLKEKTGEVDLEKKKEGHLRPLIL